MTGNLAVVAVVLATPGLLATAHVPKVILVVGIVIMNLVRCQNLQGCGTQQHNMIELMSLILPHPHNHS